MIDDLRQPLATPGRWGVDDKIAGGRARKSHDHPGDRGFSRTGLARKTENFAVLQRQVHVAHGVVTVASAVNLVQALDGNDRRACALRQIGDTRTVERRHRIQQRTRVVRSGSVQDLRAGTGLDDVAMVHNHDPIRHLTYDTEIMGDHQQRHIFFGNQLVDEIENFVLRGDVERGAGLIRDEELRLMQQRKPDQHALAHAARKLGRIGIHDPLGIAKLHAAQNRCDTGAALCLGRVDAVALVGKAHDIIEMRADLEDRIEGRQRVLHDQRKRRSLKRLAFPSRHGEHIPPVDDNGAGGNSGILRQSADDRLGGDRFTRSGFADQRHPLAG
ncbi:hypothetical protein D3C87_1333180 [compost metagenome]